MPHPIRFAPRSAALLISALALTGALAACSPSEPSESDSDSPSAQEASDGGAPLVVVDDQGREHTLDGPADRAVVIGSFNVDLVLALGARDQIVGTDQQTIDRLAASELPADLAVGANGNELNHEEIIARDPDVVLIYRNHGWEAVADQLEDFDIPVVVLSTWVFDEWDASVELAAAVLGREDGAEAVGGFSEGIGELLARTEGAEPRVLYYEDSAGQSTGNEGGKNFAILAAGVENLFGDVDGNQIDVDPEAVLQGDPDVIAVETSNTYGGTTPEDFRSVGDDLLDRVGWSELTAVQESNLWLYNAWAFDLAGNQITPLFFAKWAYPELYEDIDPLDYVEEWAEDFIGVEGFERDDGYVYNVTE